jgi:Helix-turn-helix domain
VTSIAIDPEELVADTIVAAELCQQPNTLTAWRHQGRGPPFIKVGRKVFYRRSDVASWLAGQRRDPVATRRL